MLLYLFLVLEDSVCDITVEHVDGIVFRQHGDIRVVDLVDVVGYAAVEIVDLIAVVGIGERGLPSRMSMALLEVDRMERDLDTLVRHLAGIGVCRAGVFKARSNRYGGFDKHIRSFLQISIDGKHNT